MTSEVLASIWVSPSKSAYAIWESVNALITWGSKSAGSAALPTRSVCVRIPSSASVSRRAQPDRARTRERAASARDFPE